MDRQKCSYKKHSEIDSICYCQECKIFMCNKCSNHHSELFENHHKYDLGKDKEDIFINICTENDHNLDLKFFCKTHNQLCCLGCISKIQRNGFGQHTDCDICFIDEIKDKNKSKFKENLIKLENYSTNIESSMIGIKQIIEEFNKTKEEIRIKISRIFTKIRNAVNEREDKLLLDLDILFANSLIDEKTLIEFEKLQNEIKISLDRGKQIDNEWKNNEDEKINFFINECINIENNIKDIQLISENIKKLNDRDIKPMFLPEEESDINMFIDGINKFGEIIDVKSSIFNLNSLIIKKNHEYNKLLKEWIDPNKIIKAELLFRLTRDGENISKFHELCDNKGPTLTLFCTKDDNIGGLFTPLSWDNKSSIKNDKETFIFDLNKKEKYKKANNNQSIYCDSDYGPYTCNFGFESSMKRIKHGGDYINKTFEKGSRIFSNDSKGDKYFEIKEVEIYKIIN